MNHVFVFDVFSKLCFQVENHMVALLGGNDNLFRGCFRYASPLYSPLDFVIFSEKQLRAQIVIGSWSHDVRLEQSGCC